jgi:hypothetical protein
VEAQVSQSQLLTYLQEAVSLDNELNQLRLDQMLRMSQGKTIMLLTQYLDALDNAAALADKATPQKGAPTEGSNPDSGSRRHVNRTEFSGIQMMTMGAMAQSPLMDSPKTRWFITWSTGWPSRSSLDSSAEKGGLISPQNAVNT